MNVRGWMAATAIAVVPAAAHAQAGPSFDCEKKLASSVEQRICKDEKLSALDRQLADAYAAAQYQAPAADRQTLTATQRGWIKGRNDCWKATDVPACVTTAYHTRIAELQALYRLVEPVGRARYLCPGTPPRELTADFYATDPPTAVVGFSGATQLMFVAMSGSGARYTGGNRELWEHQGAAMLTWNSGIKNLDCPKQP
jgi:uncharacterized protein